MNKVIVLVAVLLPVLLVAPSARADWLVQNGQVALVGNTTGNAPAFIVVIRGGSGVCADRDLRFLQTRAGDEDVFKRAFAVALTAT